MSDETIRALERELLRQGERVLVLRGCGGLVRATKGHCALCRCRAEDGDVRELDGVAGGWVRLCRECLESIVARTVDPQAVARVTPSDGVLYIRVVVEPVPVEPGKVVLDACGQAPCPRCSEIWTNDGRVCRRCEP